MKTIIKKSGKFVVWSIIGSILLLFALSCLFGIIFTAGVMYHDLRTN